MPGTGDTAMKREEAQVVIARRERGRRHTNT